MADREALKGHLDMLILAALEAGPAHGYALIETLRGSSGGVFALPEGTIYPALHRLERSGLLSSSWSNESGRRRRVYELSARGGRELGGGAGSGGGLPARSKPSSGARRDRRLSP